MDIEKVSIGIIGLGYVGLPLAVLFARKYPVVGYDVNSKRVEELQAGIDTGKDFGKETIDQLLSTNLTLTTNKDSLRTCNFYIVAVPTPVDRFTHPDLTPLENASRLIGEVISRGDVVVYESTVYPGVTEEVCVPIIENTSGWRLNHDFYVGYSPERIDPGSKEHRIENTVKITSGSTPEAARFIDQVYDSVLQNGTFCAKTIRVAETAKALENVQRDVNIGLMNEMAMIMDSVGVDINDVIDAAATKWNFMPFRPGLVGGHCIGVDPYYLIELAEANGVEPNLIRTARHINNGMGKYVAAQLVKLMVQHNMKVKEAHILLLGFTFKENCPDIRNTRVYDIYRELCDYTSHVTVADPWADPQLVKRVYGIDIMSDLRQLTSRKFNGIMLCVEHRDFLELDVNALKAEECAVYDVKAELDRSIVDQRL